MAGKLWLTPGHGTRSDVRNPVAALREAHGPRDLNLTCHVALIEGTLPLGGFVEQEQAVSDWH